MIIDVIFAIIVGYGMYVGYTNGIIKTVFTILSFLFGALVTAHFYKEVTDVLMSLFPYDRSLMLIVGVATTFLVTMIFLRLIGRQIENLFKTAKINFVNQIVGGVVMAVLLTVVYSQVIWFAVESRLMSDQVEDSKTYPFIQEVPKKTKVVWEKVSPAMKDLWDDVVNTMDSLGEDNRIEETSKINDFGGREFEIREVGDDEDSSN